MTALPQQSLAPVVVESHGDVVHVVLNRPQALNALNVSMLDGLLDAFRGAADAAAVVVYGEGRAFCVGEDLRETLAPATGDADELRASFERLQELTRLMVRLPAPVVVAAHGYAIGGGAELAMSADFVIATPNLKMRFPEVAIGHAVTGGISARLTATVGLVRAKDLLLSGRWIETAEAATWGMLSEVHEDAISRARELGDELAKLPGRSMAATKRGVESAAFPHLENVFEQEIGSALHCFSSNAAHAAYAPFQAG